MKQYYYMRGYNLKKTNVISNFLYNSVYQILLIILPLITTPYISRVLEADGVGTYSYTYSISYCLALVGMLGVNNYGNRTVAALQNDRKKRSTAFWNIVTPVSYTHLDVYKRQGISSIVDCLNAGLDTI